MSSEILWYIPNQVRPGHRGDDVVAGHNSLRTLTDQARALERHGWDGALIGTGWGRPDTFTVATALAAQTTTFKPLIAARPGYWRPANFASAAATLDHLTGGRVLVNIVSGQDDLAAYGDSEGDQAHRYARTKEFLQIVRRLWTEERVTYRGEHFSVTDSTVEPRPVVREGRRHPRLYFGGASEAAQRVAATEADVQLFWGEPLDGVQERIERLKELSARLGREHAPLEFGLRVTTFVRDTTEQAWADAEAKVAKLAGSDAQFFRDPNRRSAVGQQRLLDLAERGEVLDDNLYTAPGKVGGGGAGTTWLVGSPEDVAESLRKYQALGITHFVLSDTPYAREIERQGRQLLPLLSNGPAASVDKARRARLSSLPFRCIPPHKPTTHSKGSLMPQRSLPHGRNKSRMGLLTAALAALALAAAACSGSGDSSEGAGFEDCDSEPTTCNSGPRRDGGDLVWAVDGKWEAWGQADIYGSSLSTSIINQPLRPTVFGYDQNGEIHYNDGIYSEAPELVSEAPLTVAYHLKEEATWGDGTPIGIDDFVWHWKATSTDEAQCAGCAPATDYGANVASIEEGEGNSVVVTYADGYLDTEWFAAQVITHPAHIAEARGYPDWRDDPQQMADSVADFSENPPLDYSAGPFKMVEAELGDYAKYEPNPEWTGSQQSTLDSLTLRYIEGAEAMVTELRQGNIDGAAPSSFDPEVLDQLSSEPEVKYDVAPQSGWSHIDANLNNEFLADKPLRLAIFTAIDADEVNERAYGTAYPEVETMKSLLFRPESPYWSDQIGDSGLGSGDIEAARAILEEAGYTWAGDALQTPDGKPVGLNYRTGIDGNAFSPIIQDLVIAYLEELGIAVETEPISADGLSTVLEEGDFDLVQFSYIETPLFASSAAEYWGEGNANNFQNDEVDAIVDELATTLDIDEAAELNNRAAQVSLDEGVQLPLAWTPALIMVREDVVNVRDNWATTMRALSNVGEWGFAEE